MLQNKVYNKRDNEIKSNVYINKSIGKNLSKTIKNILTKINHWNTWKIKKHVRVSFDEKFSGKNNESLTNLTHK